MKQKVLLLSPPFVQLNTPYPATAYLKGFLNTLHIESQQVDLGIEVIQKLFSKDGLSHLFNLVGEQNESNAANINRIIALNSTYINVIEPVMRFLEGSNADLAYLISQRNYLPEASRFNQLEDLDWAFGNMGIHDKARHLATLFLEDISDLVIETVDEHFGFSRYAERLGQSAGSFDEIEAHLGSANTYIEDILIDCLREALSSSQATVVAISVPFPGSLYSALKCGQWLRIHAPEVTVVMGGGYPNTELRSLQDPRVFNYVHFITLDDGEAPIATLLDYLKHKIELSELKRTFTVSNGQVVYLDGSKMTDIPQRLIGTPDYSDLPLNKYLSVIEVPNPMHRLWSDGRWNKLTLAHGCYWGKCTFCDISLDYIQRYEPVNAALICDRIETLIDQTGQNGFHFVDEAAPPSLLKALAIEILKRKLTVVWWTNIRFEKNFTHDLCALLASSGCIAVSGGLEVASDRLLALIDKGVTIEQVTQVADSFTRSGVMVHAYLMYGFPTQTPQETVDSLEIVRQLFENEVIQSGFWHQFAMTAHSPIGLDPEAFQVKALTKKKGKFANNDLPHKDEVGDHTKFSLGLKKSLFNFMHGICFDFELQEWFDFNIPNTNVAPDTIQNILNEQHRNAAGPNSRILWTGNKPLLKALGKKNELIFHQKTEDFSIKVNNEVSKWLVDTLAKLTPGAKPVTFNILSEDYNRQNFAIDFESFWISSAITTLRGHGLLAL